jgi:hypothetical protein
VTASAPWFEEIPERLERELNDLAEVGASWQINQEAKVKGVLRLHTVLWPLLGGVELAVDFPDLYPYFRPEVRAPDLQLPHHQAPGHGYLCLVNRDTRNWDVDETVAEYLKKRLGRVIRAATTSDEGEASRLEEHQGEPLSDYLPYFGTSMLLVDGSWTIPRDTTQGELSIGLDSNLSARDGQVRGAVLEIRDQSRHVIAHADDAFRRLFTHQMSAPWARVERIPFHQDGGRIATDILADLRPLRFPPLRPCGSTRIALFGFLFDEEVGYRKRADSWLFALQLGS